MGQLGSTLEERYFVQKVKLGSGSFGTVWRAVDNENGRVVAIKELSKEQMRRRGITREDTAREISVLKSCQHENITALYHNYEDANSIFLALEYCDGGDFEDKLRQRASNINESEATDWIQQILSATAALHSRDICHRDIKPANFMVAGRTLKLSDFGLATYLPKGKLITEKCGTPAFMAPEQHALPGSRGYGCPVDIWAVGIILFMLICKGRHPFLTTDQKSLEVNRLMRGEMTFTEVNSFFPVGFLGAHDPNPFSEDAQAFCRQLVIPDASCRPFAAEALRHKWLLRVSTTLTATQSPATSSTKVGEPRIIAHASQMAYTSLNTWVAFEAAREAVSDVMTKTPARLSRAMEEVKDAIQSPNIFATHGISKASKELRMLETELSNMGATAHDLVSKRIARHGGGCT